MRRDDVGPELGALLASRRWLLSVALGAAWGLTSLFGIAAWGETSDQEHVVLVVSGILVLAGLVLGGRSRYLWLSTIGMALVVLSAAAAPEGSPPWIPLGTITAYAAYLTVTLCSRRVGFAVVFVGAAVLALVWSTRPSSAIPGGLAVWGGWVQVSQQIAGTLAMWWAWNTLVDEARAADRTLVALQARTAAALAVQERARLWRATATRVHESVLNSIRYVLHEGEPDRVRLGQEIAREREGREATEPAVPSSLPALIEELRADEVAGALVVVPRPGPPVQLEADVFRAGRAALIEVARNSARHGGATSIVVEVRQPGPDSIAIDVTDNGSGLSATSRPGIGTTTVLDSSLEEIGGSWSLSSAEDGGSCVTITLPCASAGGAVATSERAFPPFDKGRLLVTAPLAGTAAVGSLYFAGLLPHGGLGPMLAVVAGVMGAFAALISVVRRRRLSTRVSVLLVLAPAAVPWLLLGHTYACGEATAASRAVNIAGFSMLVIAAWGRPATGFVGLPIWAVGTVLLASGIEPDCRGFSSWRWSTRSSPCRSSSSSPQWGRGRTSAPRTARNSSASGRSPRAAGRQRRWTSTPHSRTPSSRPSASSATSRAARPWMRHADGTSSASTGASGQGSRWTRRRTARWRCSPSHWSTTWPRWASPSTCGRSSPRVTSGRCLSRCSTPSIDSSPRRGRYRP